MNSTQSNAGSSHHSQSIVIVYAHKSDGRKRVKRVAKGDSTANNNL